MCYTISKMKGFLFVVLCFLLGSTVFAAESQYILCRNKKIVRTLRANAPEKEGGNCTAIYTKNGADKEMGSGRSYNSCVNIITNIKTNLEKAGWTCKDISSSKISTAQ